MDPIKEAFARIKEDIFSLQAQIIEIKTNINRLTSPISPQTNRQTNQQINQQTNHPTPTNPTPLSTDQPIPTDKQTDRLTQQTHYFPQNTQSSIGNGGVPTNRQTNQQTDRQTNTYPEKFAQHEKTTLPEDIEKVQQLLGSLDSIKKEIRLKFKRLTPQEMLVFSTLYSLEEQNIEEISYKLLSDALKLSESSVRDYTNKLLKKGIPIMKKRLNNKKIILFISKDLKNLASLSTISRLRDI